MIKNNYALRSAFLGLLAFFGIMTGIPQHAAANLVLDRVVVEFKVGDRPVENINITNQDDKPVKVSVKTIEVKNEDQPTRKEIATDKIIVAPKAFELAAGETRAVRMVLREHPNDLESIYRIRFYPDRVTTEKNIAVSGQKSVHVGIIVSMGVLVMVAPKNPKPDLKFVRNGDVIHFTNAGNVTAQLQRDEYCGAEKKNCTILEGKRMYPSTTWDMQVPKSLSGLAFTQNVQFNGKYSSLSYPAH